MTSDPRTAVLARLAEQLLETAREVAASAPADHLPAKRLAALAHLLDGALAPALDGDPAAAAAALEVAVAAGGTAAEAVLPPAVLRTAMAAAAALDEAPEVETAVVPLRRRGTA